MVQRAGPGQVLVLQEGPPGVLKGLVIGMSTVLILLLFVISGIPIALGADPSFSLLLWLLLAGGLLYLNVAIARQRTWLEGTVLVRRAYRTWRYDLAQVPADLDSVIARYGARVPVLVVTEPSGRRRPVLALHDMRTRTVLAPEKLQALAAAISAGPYSDRARLTVDALRRLATDPAARAAL